MIVSEVMTTKLITVTPDDTLSHAANLLRQYQFHHLPVVSASNSAWSKYIDTGRKALPEFQGLLTSQDIDLAAAMGRWSSSEVLHRPWQERPVAEFMHRASIRVTPSTSVAAAAQLMVERGLNCLPVVEYEQMGQDEEGRMRTVLVGLLTRSDLLLVLARLMGAFEPGMELTIQLPAGDPGPLAETLVLAAQLGIQVRSITAAPQESGVLQVATLRLGTINPSPLLVRLREANIHYAFAGSPVEDDEQG
ncbi:MAG TPA: CBS domain-containing protein [Ktedonobacteraceae bacterium]|nr:CBS domain-containing protein [Ktedonobacteraceae bacterium]